MASTLFSSAAELLHKELGTTAVLEDSNGEECFVRVILHTDVQNYTNYEAEITEDHFVVSMNAADAANVVRDDKIRITGYGTYYIKRRVSNREPFVMFVARRVSGSV